MPRTKIVKIDPRDPEPDKIDEAVSVLKCGGLVAFPTETVYGIAALYNDAEAIRKLYEIKNRPQGKPFTVHISRSEMLDYFKCETSVMAKMLMERFWPGPMTIVLNADAGTHTVGFRMPRNKIALALIEKAGEPVVAPSANLSGNSSPRCVEDVLRDLDGKVDMVIDGGPSEIGKDSTVIDASAMPCRVLREGAIPSSSIKDAWAF